ncbi:hypothetical protein CSB69_4329 [Morganella morganii]|nr:hypothetical protein CSB69_4329 [Morganella morganii]
MITKQIPWYFFVPVSEKKDAFYLGAFSFLCDDKCVVLYIKVADKWIIRHLSMVSNIIFWCSRITILLSAAGISSPETPVSV